MVLERFGDVLINAPNASGETPLHIAARYNRADAVKALVKVRYSQSDAFSVTLLLADLSTKRLID